MSAGIQESRHGVQVHSFKESLPTAMDKFESRQHFIDSLCEEEKEKGARRKNSG
jgi:hypothetical protein